jgi:purine operon repressor
MDKVKRSERLVAMTNMLVSCPNQIISYGIFCDKFQAAKSSISEDMALIEQVLNGKVTGAAGGVRYRPIMPWTEAADTMDEISIALNAFDRALPGGYIYLSDLLADPTLTRRMGAILAAPCYELGIDLVLTMETKGIPVAMMTAEALNAPLVIARRSSKVYEGSAVNISYPDGKGGIEMMSLARRAVREGQKALIVDDFMRHGGTALGMIALMKEFRTEVAGLSFMLAQERSEPLTHLPEWPLMTFTGDGITSPIKVRTAPWLVRKREEAR